MNDDADLALRRAFARSSDPIEDASFSLAVMQRVHVQQRRRWIARCCLLVLGLLLLGAAWQAAAPELSHALAWLEMQDRDAGGSLSVALSLALGGLVFWRTRSLRRS